MQTLQPEIRAIKPANQSTVDRLLYWERRYNGLVDAGKDDTREGDRVYDKLHMFYSTLPAYERANLVKHGVDI